MSIGDVTCQGGLPIEPAEGEVHLWELALNVPAKQYEYYRQLISAEEQARAERFLRDDVRRQFVACHGTVRTILASYLAASPERLEFAAAPLGKPYLASPRTDLQFNFSHSHDKAVLALSRGFEVGVDIEEPRPLRDLRAMVLRCFEPTEQQAWQRLPAAEQVAAFFRAWVAKEAVLKMLGDGLSLGMARVKVVGASGGVENAALVENDGSSSSYALAVWQVSHGWPAAVAARRDMIRLVHKPWPPGA